VQEWYGAGKTLPGKIGLGTRQTRNPETAKGQGETVERPGMQQWHKGLRPETIATRQNENEVPRHKTAAVLRSTGSQTGLTGAREESTHDVQRFSENKEMDLVER
jgi:hypothetical protein